MRHTRLLGVLCAIGLGIWSAVAARGQAAPTATLSGELRTHLRDDGFQIVTSLRGLPLGVRAELQALFGGRALDIAEPGAAFRAGDATGDARLPLRRLVAAGCSYERCLVYYERGGPSRAWRAVLFHWTPDETRFEWGGAAPGGLSSIDDVRHVILSGPLEDPAGVY
jgi:hypothetical protein